eukprot:m.271933 g.271933  ORF g.271933 m.271933 type:complete len:53 (+) comp40555_c0_seq47:4075-4233(+)
MPGSFISHRRADNASSASPTRAEQVTFTFFLRDEMVQNQFERLIEEGTCGKV